MDIRRTVLWVVFSLSLLMLWDKWQQHNGKPPMLFPGTSEQAKPAGSGVTGNANSAALPSVAGKPSAAIGIDAANVDRH